MTLESDGTRSGTRLFDRVVARRLTRLHGGTRALSNLDLTLRAGDITTLEGPNGAGKSTLLALLATIARPTSGQLRFGELDPATDLEIIRPAIGMVAHEALVYPDLTPRETLSLMARAYSLPDANKLVERSLRDASLMEIADRPARTFSRGQLQRLGLARARLHDPDLVLLDEPTTGLDKASTERLVETLLKLLERKKIVVLVTHDAALAERVATRRVFLERGRLVRDEVVPSKAAATRDEKLEGETSQRVL